MSLFWRLSGPALECVVEGARFAIAEEPWDFGDWEIPFLQITAGKIKSQLIQNFAKGHSLTRKPAFECSRAHPEPLGNFGYSGLSVRQQWSNGIFNAELPGT